jgi:hypothetical protein
MPVRDYIRRLVPHARRAGMLAVALVAAGIVTSLTIDVGPFVRTRVEQYVSVQMQRPITMENLGIRLYDGRVVARNLTIAGFEGKGQPFLFAPLIEVSVAVWPLLNREISISSVEMADWRMRIEQYPGGRHNFPHIPTRSSKAPGLFSTSVNYVHAYRGTFSYADFGTPWGADVPDVDITLMQLAGYRGHLGTGKGNIWIQKYEPAWGDMRAWFRVEKGLIRFEKMTISTYGSETTCTGVMDPSHWPEQQYQVDSVLQLPQIKDIFWAHDNFTLGGEAFFNGTFHIFKGGRELKGDFHGEDPTLNAYHFPGMAGSLIWTQDRFDVTRSRSVFYGGHVEFVYHLWPLNMPDPAHARLETTYDHVDLKTLSDAMHVQGIRLAGRATGFNLLEWRLRHWDEHSGSGTITSEPPPGVRLQGRAVPATIQDPPIAHVFGDLFPMLDNVAVGGSVAYDYGPEWVTFAPGHVATASTFVEFQGRSAWGDRCQIPFHVTSSDWQESARVLSGVLTAFGSPTKPFEMGGGGTFDGTLTKLISRPRIEGKVVGTRMRAWDVEWGDGAATVAIENLYLETTDAWVRRARDASEIRASGKFSMGYPRKDHGEEINGRISSTDWPLEDFRRAFLLDDYPIFGAVTGEIHIYGAYLGPYGFGRGTVTDAVAYDEYYNSATSPLRFDGTGVWLDGFEVRKGDTGIARGTAHVEWLGDYSFNCDGRNVPIEAIQMWSFNEMPLHGFVEFTASGSGNLVMPEYEARGRLRDVFVGEEGVGTISGRVKMHGDEMSFEMEGGSPRMGVTGTGRMMLLGDYAGELQFRFTDTSLDPFARVFMPGLSPFASVVASGTVRAAGSFITPEGVAARVHLDKVDMRMFDYQLANDGPLDISLDQGAVKLERFRLKGEDTRFAVSGQVDVLKAHLALHAEGDANLGVLQAFSRDLRSSGRAVVAADVGGTLDKPLISGSADLTDCRFRSLQMPHAIEQINGRVAFDGRNIRFDDLRAKFARGDLRFGGRVGLEGFAPSVLDLTANGDGIELRYPEGFRSLLDADLALRGTVTQPVLSGTVQVRAATLKRRVDLGAGMLELGAAAASAAPATAGSGPSAVPLRLDVRILAPQSLEIDNNLAHITSSADLRVGGTTEKPLVFGHAEVDRGEVWFEGKRIVVTRGSVDFTNPAKIEPSFDVEAETRVRAPGQTYRITMRMLGTTQHMNLDLSSDPPLPQVDIVTLLLGDAGATEDPELRALQNPDSAERTLLQARAARLLASPIASNVGRVVERTFGVDTFQITPMLTDASQQTTRFTPGARLTIGKRVSDRVYLTYSRSLTSSIADQVILLEYDQNDRLSWMVTQNEDRTYAIDVRVRHIF